MNLQYLYADQEIKKVFAPVPFASFRSAINLKRLLVRSKVFLLKRKTGSGKCNGTNTFISFQTKKQYKINHNLNCSDKCLVYLFLRKICGLQYVRSTTNPFRYRWNNYKDNNRKAERGVEYMQIDLFEHFVSNGHNGFLEDCNITLIDKTDGADPTRREEYWRRVLKTVSPYGLNTVA